MISYADTMPRLSITWIRFRAGDAAHAITGLAKGFDGTECPERWQTACGAEFNRRTGEQDDAAKRCEACQQSLSNPES